MDKLFKGQTVVISGGLGDIGFASALKFAEQGADVSLADIRPVETAQSYLDRIRSLGVNCIYQELDVSDYGAVHSWLARTEAELSTPSLIIVNAAIVNVAGYHSTGPEQWQRELRINLDGAFFLSQKATQMLKDKSLSGRVVFVGSWASTHVHAHMPAYSVAKAGLSMMCKCLALELAADNILVNEIAPGYVNAGLSGRIWKENPGRIDSATQKVPVKRVMNAEEVADKILFLCHPDNVHMTGSTLLMDGGLSLL